MFKVGDLVKLSPYDIPSPLQHLIGKKCKITEVSLHPDFTKGQIVKITQYPHAIWSGYFILLNEHKRKLPEWF